MWEWFLIGIGFYCIGIFLFVLFSALCDEEKHIPLYEEYPDNTDLPTDLGDIENPLNTISTLEEIKEDLNGTIYHSLIEEDE